MCEQSGRKRRQGASGRRANELHGEMQARGVRAQGNRIGRQAAQGRCKEEFHGQMSEGASLVRSRSEMATPLFACALLLAGTTAAAAQVQNYPASPYFSPQAAPKAPSPYFGTNPNQNRDRGYMSKNHTIRTASTTRASPVPTGRGTLAEREASTADAAGRSRHTYNVSASTRSGVCRRTGPRLLRACP